jgi:hypothetical protein
MGNLRLFIRIGISVFYVWIVFFFEIIVPKGLFFFLLY